MVSPPASSPASAACTTGIRRLALWEFCTRLTAPLRSRSLHGLVNTGISSALLTLSCSRLRSVVSEGQS
jgi:hypothetical protein